MKHLAAGRRILIVTHVDWRTYYQPQLIARFLAERGAEVLLISTLGLDWFGPWKYRDTNFPQIAGRPAVLLQALAAARFAALQKWDAIFAFDLASLVPVLPLADRFNRAAFKAAWFLEFEEDGYQQNSRTRAGLRWLERNAPSLDCWIDPSAARAARRGSWSKFRPPLIMPNAPPIGPHSVWNAPPARRISDNLPTIVYAGTNADYARLDSFLRGMALRRGSVRAVLCLTGPEERTIRLRELAVALDVAGWASVNGPAGAVHDFLWNNGHIGLCLSGALPSDPINRKFPAPNKLGEYLSQGLACLVSHNVEVPGVPIDSIGAACDPEDPADIARAIDRLCAWNSYAERGERARRVFEDSMNFEHFAEPLFAQMLAHWGEAAPVPDIPRPPRVALVMTTRNRRDTLRAALTENLKQDCAGLEIWVFDDASDDGTAEMLAAEFPQVRHHREPAAVGYIRLRNLAARMLTQCSHIAYTDDDSWFLTADGIRRAIGVFESQPDTAYVACEIFAPYHAPLPTDPTRDGMETPLFVGCGFVVDRIRFLELGAFPEWFDFYGEEADFALRVAGSRYVGRFAAGSPVYHAIASTNRNRPRILAYSLANSVSTFLVREPFPECLLHTAAAMVRSLVICLGERELGAWVRGIALAMRRIPIIARERKPVPRRAWQWHREQLREWRAYFEARERGPR